MVKEDMLWKYTLRCELPPYEDMQGLNKLNLAHNRFTSEGVIEFAECLSDDKFVRSINLRSNAIGDKGVKAIKKMFRHNKTIFSVDLRGNEGLSGEKGEVLHRQIAVQLLANYTRAGQYTLKNYGETAWLQEQLFFDYKLLIVKIPDTLLEKYSKKLENIRQRFIE